MRGDWNSFRAGVSIARARYLSGSAGQGDDDAPAYDCHEQRSVLGKVMLS
jgi:hypothetical protein